MLIFSASTILVPLWFTIIPLVFVYLCKVFSGLLQFNGNFVDGLTLNTVIAPLRSGKNKRMGTNKHSRAHSIADTSEKWKKVIIMIAEEKN